MAATILQLVILFLFILFGFAIGKRKSITMEKSNILSVLLVNIFLPCKIFLSFSKNCTSSYFKVNYPTVLVSTGILLFLVLFSHLTAKLLSKDAYKRNIYRYSFAISNYAYLGYVLVEAVLGEQALTDMILFCIPFAFYTYTFGFALLNNKAASFKKAVNPMTIAIAIGMVFGLLNIPVPAFLTSTFSMASNCVGPLSMVLIGLVLSTLSFRELLPNWETVVFTLFRLVIIPAILLGLCHLLELFLPLPDAVYPAVVIMGCMPCGLNTIVFPSLVGEDCSTGARFVLFSHILCLATVPLWMYIIG